MCNIIGKNSGKTRIYHLMKGSIAFHQVLFSRTTPTPHSFSVCFDLLIFPLEIMLLLSHMIHLAFFFAKSLYPSSSQILFFFSSFVWHSALFISYLFGWLSRICCCYFYHYRVYCCYRFPHPPLFSFRFLLCSCLFNERYTFLSQQDITGKTCSLLCLKFLWHIPSASVIFHKLHNICRWKIAWWRLFHFLFFNFRFQRPALSWVA